MMLELDEVRRIAHLARLELTPEEEELFTSQLARIVHYIDQLEGFEVADRAEDPSLAEIAEAEDQVVEGLARETFLANTPQRRDGFLLVPRVKVVGEDPEP